MVDFVNNYRKLTKIPTPELESLKISELFDNIYNLMRAEINKNNIKLKISCINKNLEINADNKLMEQVLINLLLNCIDALKDNKSPLVKLSAYSVQSRKIIEIYDNGTGIDNDKIDKIFIPFYSTKENGSGIGLSLSKQIMKLHNGNIEVHSQKNVGTTVLLSFS